MGLWKHGVAFMGTNVAEKQVTDEAKSSRFSGYLSVWTLTHPHGDGSIALCRCEENRI